ncbi:uncharacterized protein FIESC28_09104 [Fusarium coffeatum]|uniref:Uncharacterized protein n=1 Tax=Fusarium coffeatum TaxID=231269 RepID=A0A366R4M3_9HYPO|nr:uncharacterized protein FIESC28_09104 [Fusarium coffeatum]RBR11220.1 hypothetical protein FIESC28_09104 [Fusarium coffeatum]
MLASIILERRSVTIDGSAKLSVIRSSNAAPMNLLQSLYGNVRGASLWGIVVLCLTITTSALQLASTALVRDMGIGQLVREEQDTRNLAALSWDNHNLSAVNDMQRERYWLETVKDFPTFAERRSPFVTNARETKTIRDTGLVHRAFIPFRNATVRTSIKRYKGLSTVIDSRVACVQPRIHDGLGVAFVEGWGWYLNGTFIPNDMPEGLIGGDSAGNTADLHNRTLDTTLGIGPKTTLTRAQELPYTHDAGEWNIITKVIYSGPKLLSAFDPRYADIVSDTTTSFERGEGSSYHVIGDDITLLTGRSYLLINITSAMGRRAIVNETDTTSPRDFYFSPRHTKHKLLLKGQDEWLTFRLYEVPTFRLAVSLCFDSFVSVEANVSITAPSDRPVIEPNLGTWNTKTTRFNTTDARAQLDYEKHHRERHVMKLDTTAEDFRNQTMASYNLSRENQLTRIKFPFQDIIPPYVKYSDQTGGYMCASCGIQFDRDDDPVRMNPQIFNRVHQQMFQDTLRATNNSAKAWQNLMTLIGRMAYYDKTPYFDYNDTAQITWFYRAQFPRTSEGFWATVGVLGGHVVLVVFIIACFILNTEVSCVGDNIWQCIAQTNYDEDGSFLRGLTTKKDSEVEKLFQGSGLDKETVTLQVIQEASGQRIGLRNATASGVSTHETGVYQRVGDVELSERVG